MLHLEGAGFALSLAARALCSRVCPLGLSHGPPAHNLLDAPSSVSGSSSPGSPPSPHHPIPQPRTPHTPQDAEKQLDAAIAYKASFLDGHLGKSALAQLRAKLAADYLIVPVK